LAYAQSIRHDGRKQPIEMSDMSVGPGRPEGQSD
jgi:hypothetical protein